MRLNRPISIPEAAKRANWSRWKMWRHLEALNEKHGGTLLLNVSRSERPRYVITEESLAKLGLVDSEGPTIVERLDELEEKMASHRKSIRTIDGKLERLNSMVLDALRRMALLLGKTP